MPWIAFVGIFLLASVAQAADPVPAAFPYNASERTLPNGLRVVVIPMPSPGVVTFGTWMSVGSGDEVDAGRSGFAHFFEHLMFLGTPAWPAAARDAATLRMAADDNAWTYLDETVYHLTLPSTQLDTIVPIEADRFQHLVLTPDDVRREAGAVYGEFRKGKVDPTGQLVEALYATAFTVHPYHHDTIGLEADIAAMPTAHAYAASFFERYYRPSNATVLVVGDVEPEHAFALVAGAYGSWAVGAAPRPEVPPEPPQQGLRRGHVAWPNPTAPLVAYGWRIPASSPDDRAVAALDLLDALLLSDVGPLAARLVRQEELAFEVTGGRDDSAAPGLFKIVLRLRPDADMDRVDAILREEIAQAAEHIDADALNRLRAHRLYGWLADLDDPLDVFNAVGWALRRGGSIDAINRSLASLAAVTPDDVRAAVHDFLCDDGLSVVTLTADDDTRTP